MVPKLKRLYSTCCYPNIEVTCIDEAGGGRRHAKSQPGDYPEIPLGTRQNGTASTVEKRARSWILFCQASLIVPIAWKTTYCLPLAAEKCFGFQCSCPVNNDDTSAAGSGSEKKNP